LTVEIKPTGEVFTDSENKKWLPVNISFDAISQINKIVIGDHVDDDDSVAVAKRKQIHDDAIELFQLFTSS
jgi:hypothetical protein